MKKKTLTKLKIVIIVMLLLVTTGCATNLTTAKKKAVTNPTTGQSLTKNILCQPTDKATIKLYKKYGVDTDKLPTCPKFKINSGKYEDLWTAIFVKPLAWLLIFIGEGVGNYAVSLIIVSLAIRLIAYPFTKKMAVQSELMKKAQPEMNKVQKKYQGKQDQQSMMAQSQETMAIYKKYGINPVGSCIFAFLQFPLFMAFFEAVQRTPAIFEGTFIGFQLGTTPLVGLKSSTAIMYILLVVAIGATTYYSFKQTMATTGNSSTDKSMQMMPQIMTAMIVFMGFVMPSALGIYWVTSNLFTIVQNIIVKRSKIVNGKA
jgi:YidC/Oxa1 family membrane protein insertase